MKFAHYSQIFSLNLLNYAYLVTTVVRKDGKPWYDSEIRRNSRKKRD